MDYHDEMLFWLAVGLTVLAVVAMVAMLVEQVLEERRPRIRLWWRL